MLLKGWSWLGEGAGSDIDGSSMFVSLDSELGRVPDVSILASLTSYTHDSCVNSARNAVLHLNVDFWEVELFAISRFLLNILPGGSIDDGLHLESLDSLVLADGSSAVAADDCIRMTLVFFTPTVVSSLRWHFYINDKINILFSSNFMKCGK